MGSPSGFYTQGVINMVLIRVEYDAYNRRFKLLDRELARLLEDGEQYLLVADLAVQDLEPTDLTMAASNLLTYAESKG
jgi:hypothetical protein